MTDAKDFDPGRCLRSAALSLRARRALLDDLTAGRVWPACEQIARRSVRQHEANAKNYMRLAVVSGRAKRGP